LYSDPRFRGFMLLNNLALYCANHMPRFGDTLPDFKKADLLAHPFDRSDLQYLEYLYARTQDPVESGKLAALMRWLTNGELDRRRAESLDRRWLFFHARPVPDGPEKARGKGQEARGCSSPLASLLSPLRPPETLAPALSRRLQGCNLYGQKGIGILRA